MYMKHNLYKLTTSVAIILWSLSAVLLSHLSTPPIEGLIITTTIASSLIAAKITWQKNWQKLMTHKKQIMLTGIFLSINNLGYYLSFRYISATLIDIICWLWPAILLTTHSFIYKNKLNFKTKAAILLSTIAVLIIHPIKIDIINNNFLIGIALSFMATFAWCGYSLVTNKYKNIPSEFFIISIALSLPFLILLHFLFEPNIVPNTQDWQILLTLGLGPASMAFFCWDYSLKKGPLNIITISSCCIPVFSIIILIFFDRANFSINLLEAMILLVISNILVIKS
jgi:drug/metabolite transporter (DMT)-like permease